MILLDSSFIIALYNTRDQHHENAQELIKSIMDKDFGDIFISDYIFDEVATCLLKNIGHHESVKICDVILNSSNLVFINETLFKRSFEIFKKQKNTRLSFTDCTNIIIMEERGMRNIAAFDGDFRSVDGINLLS